MILHESFMCMDHPNFLNFFVFGKFIHVYNLEKKLDYMTLPVSHARFMQFFIVVMKRKKYRTAIINRFLVMIK